jgi:hypothetical protein
MRILIVLLALIGCGRSESEKPKTVNSSPPAEDVSRFDAKYNLLEARLLTEYLESGFPVSREGGEARDRGDAALFAGIAIGTLDCEAGRSIFEAIAATVGAAGGMIYRHPLLEPQTALKHGPTSRDAMIGVQFGLVSRWRRCPEDRQTIADLWALHRNYVEELGNGRLFPGAGEDKQINGGLFWLWDRTANFFGINANAPRVPKERFNTDLIATASAIVAAKQACYPLHLGMLQMLTAELIGSPVNSFTRFSWCSATNGTGNPMIEWFCERGSPSSWLDNYSLESGFKYQHQKCKWQDADGVKELGPGLDFLLLKRLAGKEIF